ncbi:uncharacterized protein CEXT_808151 [Caerostris extrusa]|uniref:Uncharacterized protein n=1 Tax=Caerostris extrusa TaxID=172846 RepID=A0AAV4S5G0_CAEEX|nr:uncharacterized protein CEXT_808151 [Caerostris extrusa]
MNKELLAKYGDELLYFLSESVKSFDKKAAERATADQARKCLKVLKHYIRASFSVRNINLALKIYLNCCGIEPEVPGSVMGDINML